MSAPIDAADGQAIDAYHLELVGAAQTIGLLAESAQWFTYEVAAALHHSGRAVQDLTVMELIAAIDGKDYFVRYNPPDPRATTPAAPDFAAGSVRAAVAAFGDAWHAAFMSRSLYCAPALDEALDYDAMTYCFEELGRGRHASMEDRAFFGLEFDEVAT